MSFGEELRRERELREIGLREISEATKINIRYLQALEDNDFAELPGGVFNRGFVRAYAQFIGIDAEGMVDAYLHEERERGGPVAEPLASSVPGNHVVPAGPRVPPWLWIALAIVLAAAAGVAWWWMQGRAEVAVAEQRPPAPAIAANAPATYEVPPSLAIEPRGNELNPRATSTGAPPTGLPGRVELPSTRTAQGAQIFKVFVDDAVSGRLTCDGTRREPLDGVLAGTRIELACNESLTIDVDDAGALRLAVGEDEPRPLGTRGRPLHDHRIEVTAPGEVGRR